MAEHHTDEQQLEEIKKWWSENGKALIAGALLGLGGLLVWRGWGYYQETQAQDASEHYAVVVQAASKDEIQPVIDNTDELKNSYSSTPYAALAALELAKFKARNGDLDEAAERLRWVLGNSSQQTVRNMARIRLARLLNAQNKNDEALELLSSAELSPGYTSLIEEIKGDALLAKGEKLKAREAYTKALIGIGGNSEYLRMKRDDLGEAPERDEA